MIYKIAIFTALLEILTILGRMRFGSAQAQFKKNKFKYKVRIHHGYYGIALIIIFQFFPIEWLAIAGWTLLISDTIHHFIVLPIWIGRTEFP